VLYDMQTLIVWISLHFLGKENHLFLKLYVFI